MKKTIIYGHSDDNIELDGAIQDEIGCFGHEKPIKFSCSDGTTGDIFYGAKWEITVKTTGTLFEKLVLANPDEDDHTDEDCKDVAGYSDALVLKPGIEWVKIGRKKYHAK